MSFIFFLPRFSETIDARFPDHLVRSPETGPTSSHVNLPHQLIYVLLLDLLDLIVRWIGIFFNVDRTSNDRNDGMTERLSFQFKASTKAYHQTVIVFSGLSVSSLMTSIPTLTIEETVRGNGKIK